MRLSCTRVFKMSRRFWIEEKEYGSRLRSSNGQRTDDTVADVIYIYVLHIERIPYR